MTWRDRQGSNQYGKTFGKGKNPFEGTLESMPLYCTDIMRCQQPECLLCTVFGMKMETVFPVLRVTDGVGYGFSIDKMMVLCVSLQGILMYVSFCI